ncbi:MAG: hypothetical protein IPI73_31050 [Betaproteobacteria bacterium]|nr:hypothetical protein [Betaproteobacteria bacterium]
MSKPPTRVLEDIRIAAPRLRNLNDDPALAAIKTRLQDLFRLSNPQPRRIPHQKRRQFLK